MRGLMQDSPLTLHVALRRATTQFASKAVTCFDGLGEHRSNWREVGAQAGRIAQLLDDLGVPPGARVATLAWNSHRHLALYLGVPCSGRVLHTLNTRLSADELAYIAAHAADDVLFIDRSVSEEAWRAVSRMRSVRHVVVMDDEPVDVPGDPRALAYEEALGGLDPAEFAAPDERGAACMCYTSGTTGNPKGVVYSHRSTLLHTFGIMAADSLAVSERDVVMPVVPMFHANAWGLPFAAALSGASIVLPGGDLAPDRLARIIEGERVTFSAGVPTIWNDVLPHLDGRDVSALRAIYTGGSAVPRELSERYRERTGLPLLQGFGMTETNPVAVVSRVRSDLAHLGQAEQADIRASIGLPIAGMETRVVDDAGAPVRRDGLASGELQLRGPWVLSAYYDAPDSDTAFTTDGWFRTGDLATVDAHGYLRIVDRLKDLVKSGGEWIASGVVEAALRSHPAVADVAVVGVAHERWQERPIACVVLADGVDFDLETMRGHLVEHVPRWWIPDAVVLIDEVPRTSVGKPAKRILRERHRDSLKRSEAPQ